MVKKISIFFCVLLLFLNCQRNKIPTVYTDPKISCVDFDGNTYRTVKIGDRYWTAENLRVTHYWNGDPIARVDNPEEWSNMTTGAYCVYDNDETNAETYGYLYNWYAVTDERGIAPEGWYVPTFSDWGYMEMYLGMSQEEVDEIGTRGEGIGGMLKENGTDLWLEPNTGANNITGFSAIPGGARFGDGHFDYEGQYAVFWSSSKYFSGSWYRALMYDSSEIQRNSVHWEYGLSVRLIANKIAF